MAKRVLQIDRKDSSFGHRLAVSYVRGVAKAMDATNSIPIFKKRVARLPAGARRGYVPGVPTKSATIVRGGTVVRAWEDTGKDMLKAMNAIDKKVDGKRGQNDTKWEK